jgi:hypothetical protein
MPKISHLTNPAGYQHKAWKTADAEIVTVSSPEKMDELTDSYIPAGWYDFNCVKLIPTA